MNHSLLSHIWFFVQLLLDCSIRTALLSLAIALFLKLRRKSSATVRQSAWLTILLAMFIFPALSSWVKWPLIQIEPHVNYLFEGSSQWPRRALLGKNEPGGLIPTASQSAVQHYRRNLGSIEQFSFPNFRIALSLSYLIGLLWLLARVVLSLLLTQHLIRQCAPITKEDPAFLDSCPFLASILNTGIEVLAGADILVPITIGCFKPKILLPIAWREWNPAKLNAVLAHELAHARRYDYLFGILAAINRSIYWFNPVAWLIPERLSNAAEECCDAVAIQSSSSAKQYAIYLLEIATAMEGRRQRILTFGAAIMRPNQLGMRIDAILDPLREPYRPWTLMRFATFAIFVIAATIPFIGPHFRAVKPIPSLLSAATDRPDTARIVAAETFLGKSGVFNYPIQISDFHQAICLNVAADVTMGRVKWEFIDPNGVVQSRVSTIRRSESELDNFKHLAGKWTLRVTLEDATGKYQIHTRGL